MSGTPAVILGGSLILLGSWLCGWSVREFRSFEQVSGGEAGKERPLDRAFGEEYRRYHAETPRFFVFPGSR